MRRKLKYLSMVTLLLFASMNMIAFADETTSPIISAEIDDGLNVKNDLESIVITESNQENVDGETLNETTAVETTQFQPTVFQMPEGDATVNVYCEMDDDFDNQIYVRMVEFYDSEPYEFFLNKENNYKTTLHIPRGSYDIRPEVEGDEDGAYELKYTVQNQNQDTNSFDLVFSIHYLSEDSFRPDGETLQTLSPEELASVDALMAENAKSDLTFSWDKKIAEESSIAESISESKKNDPNRKETITSETVPTEKNPTVKKTNKVLKTILFIGFGVFIMIGAFAAIWVLRIRKED